MMVNHNVVPIAFPMIVVGVMNMMNPLTQMIGARIGIILTLMDTRV
jgi:hypothetical protein